jgi:hypothetical protein
VVSDLRRMLEEAREADPRTLLVAAAAMLAQALAAMTQPEPSHKDRRLYKPNEAAALVNLSSWTLCKAARRGIIGRKVSGRWRFTDDDLELVRKGLP